MQDDTDEIATALARGDIENSPVTESERALLRFAKLITEHAHRTTAEDVERLRAAGWDDNQIAEAVYIIALFAFFNRVADAFGLADPQYQKQLGLPRSTAE